MFRVLYGTGMFNMEIQIISRSCPLLHQSSTNPHNLFPSSLSVHSCLCPGLTVYLIHYALPSEFHIYFLSVKYWLHVPAYLTLLFCQRAGVNFEVRHPRCVGSITKNFCVLHIQSNTSIFHLVVQYEYNYMFRPYVY